ncbi:MAG: hypothetical protein MZU95_14725 [Desulfomicrobium escambiense]|nr:hypothetical protein [Desulfomicrobium escambiense]
MKVASNDVLEKLIKGLSAGPAHSAQKSTAGSEGFSQLLKEIASEGTDTKDDTDKIAVMLEFVKMQMSQSVMNSFAGKDGEGEGDIFHFMSGLTGYLWHPAARVKSPTVWSCRFHQFSRLQICVQSLTRHLQP